MCQFLQGKQLKDLYSSFIKPYTEYGNLASGGSSKNKPIRIRIMMFKGKRGTVQPLYEHLNILPLNLNKKLLCEKIYLKNIL